MKKIELRNVSYTYSRNTPFETKALDNVSCSFEGNCITGLIGHTGSGKSTLVQMLNGILKPDEGEILLDGKNIWENPKEISKIRFKVGLIFQYPEYQLFEETVYKDVAFGPRNMGLDEEEIKKRVISAIKFVGLDESFLDKSPFDLSGGEKRRVAIAGIYAMEPEVIIMDEPAAGLDPSGREIIFDGISRYQDATDSTVIIVSHSMEDMSKYAHRIIVMNDAKIVVDDIPDNIFKNEEILEDIGLDVPQITKLMLELKKLGVDCRTNIFRIEDALAEIVRIKNGGKND